MYKKIFIVSSLLISLCASSAFAEKSAASQPKNLPDLFTFLNTQKLTFVECADTGDSFQERCWENGEEGSSPRTKNKSKVIYYKDKTGELDTQGAGVSFMWKEQRYIIVDESETIEDFFLTDGFYLLSPYDNNRSLMVLIDPDYFKRSQQ